MSRDNINFAYNLYNNNDNSDTNSISNHEISTDDLILFQTMVTNLLLERTNFPLDEPKKYKYVISKTAKKQLKQTQYKTGLCNNVCPIYKCEFIENEIITVLPCNHGFKTEAIDRWLNEEKAECPVCRLEFDSIEVKVKKDNPFESNTSDLHSSLFDDTENDQISELDESDLECDPISESESDLESDPISEDSFMTGKLEPTNSPYAMAKIAAIEIGRSLNTQFNHNVINLMPTNLYGPNDFYSETDSHVIPGLIYRMHKAKTENLDNFNIWGTGKPLREFLYVDDLSLAINFIIENEITIDLLNIGSGDEISIKELSEKIKTVVGYEGVLQFDESKPDGNPRKLLDSSLINNLGWESTIKLEDGLKNSYDWFLNNKT